MKDIFLKYSLIGLAISFVVVSCMEFIINGTYGFDISRVMLYVLAFTFSWSIGMSAISLYNAKNKQQEISQGSNENSEGGILYYYNDYVNGFCRVERIEYNSPKDFENESYRKYFGFLDKEGNLITKKWYVGASEFFDNGLAIIEEYDKNGNEIFNIINGEGKELSISWFYSIYGYSDGVCKVGWNDGTINFIDENGNLLWKKWKKELEIEQ